MLGPLEALSMVMFPSKSTACSLFILNQMSSSLMHLLLRPNSKEQNVASASAPLTEPHNVIAPDATLSEPVSSTSKDQSQIGDGGPLAVSDPTALIEPTQTGKNSSDAAQIPRTPQSACKEVISSALDAHSVAAKQPLKRAATESKQKTVARKLLKEGLQR